MKKEVLAGARPWLRSRFFFSLILFPLVITGCSLFKTRPVQQMSDTNAAIKAAKEVQADVLAPELYRQANDWWRRARKEYRYKNFELAEEYAQKARRLAEQAEFEVIKSGGQRAEPAQPEVAPASTESPYPYPAQTGTPADPSLRSTPTTTNTATPQPTPSGN